VNLAISNIEQVVGSDFLAARNFKQAHSGWHVFVFSYPVDKNIVSRRPGEISNSWNLDASFVEKTKGLKIRI
jgi:hypothetical protein